jgi:polysaccharide export outer membrane protein
VLIVYSVTFSDPAGYFLATRVQMHNNVEITKFMTFLNALLSVPLQATSLGVNVESWRFLSQTHPGTATTVVSPPPVVTPPPAAR